MSNRSCRIWVLHADLFFVDVVVTAKVAASLRSGAARQVGSMSITGPQKVMALLLYSYGPKYRL